MSYLSKVAKGIKTQKKEKKITKERRNVFIIDDSMIKGLAERGIARDHNMKVRPQPGWTTQNIEDHTKPILHKNTDAIIIHLRMINQKKKKAKKVVRLIEDTNPDIQVLLSGLIHREYSEVKDKIEFINNQSEIYSNSKNFLFVSHLTQLRISALEQNRK